MYIINFRTMHSLGFWLQILPFIYLLSSCIWSLFSCFCFYRDLGHLSILLCNIAASLGEAIYVDYYIRDYPGIVCEIHSFRSASAPRTPPCLFHWLEKCLQLGYDSANLNDIPFLVRKNKCHVVSWARKIVSFFSLLLGAERIGKKLSSGVYYNIAKGSANTPEELTVLAMVAERFGRQQLDLLPIGVSLPLRHVSFLFSLLYWVWLCLHVTDNWFFHICSLCI